MYRKRRRRITADVLHLLHDRQVELFGGLPGVRDENAILSAVDRPRSRWHYGRVRDVRALAAPYLCALARKQGFTDGNTRTALAAVLVFLDLNGKQLEKALDEVYSITMRAATGELDADAVTAWFRGDELPPKKRKRSSRSRIR